MSEATKSQIIYARQEEVKGDKTGGVQRMRKERRDLEERAIKANEMIAASHKLGPILSKALRTHVDEITEDLVHAIEERDNTMKELAEAKEQISELTAIRQELIHTQHEYHRIFGPLPEFEKLIPQITEHPFNPKGSSLSRGGSIIDDDDATNIAGGEQKLHGDTTEEQDWVHLINKQQDDFEAF